MFVHCVYFWLRDDLAPGQRAAFDSGVRALTAIESVEQSWVGAPAGTDRPVIDQTYSCALIVVFADRPAHDAYQAHPIHDAFRAECSSFWSRVQIYDTDAVRTGGAAG